MKDSGNNVETDGRDMDSQLTTVADPAAGIGELGHQINAFFVLLPDHNSEDCLLWQPTIYGSARARLSAGETATTLSLLVSLRLVIRERVW